MSRTGRLGLYIAFATLAVVAVLVLVASLSSVSDPRVVGSSPSDSSRDVPVTSPVRVAFAQPMDHASVESRLHIEPEVAGRIAWEDADVVFRPLGGFLPGTQYTVRLEEGAVSQGGQTLTSSLTWSFRTRPAQLLYLGRPSLDGDVRQLYVAGLDGTPPRQMTHHPWGVWDYAVHPQGEAIVYSALRVDGGSDLWSMERDGSSQRLLLACPDAACVHPAWAPQGDRIAFERRDIWAGAPNLDPKAGRIWLLDIEDGSDRPLLDYDVPLHSPVWAPDGELLAMVSPLLPGVEVYDMNSGEFRQFGNQWGAAPVWSPDSDFLVLPDLLLDDESFVVRLVRVDVEGGLALDISGEDRTVKDTSPAWSPAGGWIAHGREFLDEARWTPGRQIWLTRPDGSDAYVLFAEPMSDLFALAWRPDAGALAYLRTDLAAEPQPVPEVSVWVFDLIDGEAFRVADQGVLPAWLP